jgi:hypothetical protein
VKRYILSTAGANQVGCASRIVRNQIVLLPCTCMHTHTCMSTANNNSTRATCIAGRRVGRGGDLSIPVLHGYILYPDILAGYKKKILFILSIFLKSIYSYQMHFQEYVNLKKYAHFIILDLSQKYSKLDLVCKFFFKYPISSTPTWYGNKKKRKT